MGNTTVERRVGPWGWLFHLDRILRGEATQPSAIRKADIQIPLFGIAFLVFALGVIYGLCMSVFAVVNGFENEAYQKAMMQTVATMCKVPLLFLLTLVVTFPSLYVFNALVGSKLRGVPVLKLLIASLGVNLSVLASMGPILAFFSVSTPNYSFIVLLNVVLFAIAGMLGLAFLIQTLNRLSLAQSRKSDYERELETSRSPSERVEGPLEEKRDDDQAGDQASTASEGVVESAGAADESKGDSQYYLAAEEADKAGKDGIEATVLDGTEIQDTPHGSWDDRSDSTGKAGRDNRLDDWQVRRPKSGLDQLEGVVLGKHVKKVFCVWIVVYGLVGAQMGWVLRPFIGSPNTDFSWFRARDSNFFQAVLDTINNLLAQSIV